MTSSTARSCVRCVRLPATDYGALGVAAPRLQERLRIAREIPQAVTKITKFQRAVSQCSRHWSYISRKAKLELETQDGDQLRSLSEQKDLLNAWELDFDHHKRSRNSPRQVPLGKEQTQ